MRIAGSILAIAPPALIGRAPLTLGPQALPKVGGRRQELPGKTFRHMDARIALRCGPQSETPH